MQNESFQEYLQEQLMDLDLREAFEREIKVLERE